MSSRSPRPGRPVDSSLPGRIPDLRRFKPTEQQWTNIAAKAGLEALPAQFRSSLTAACDTYIQSRAATGGAIATKNVLGRAQRAKAALVPLRSEFGRWDLDPTAELEWREFATVMVAVIKDNQLPSIEDFEAALAKLDHLLSATIMRLEGEMRAQRRVPTEGSNRNALIAYLADAYEALSGNRPSVRKDLHDLGRASPFIDFLAAVWAALPEGAPAPNTLNNWALKARQASGANWGGRKATMVPERSSGP